MPDGSLKVIDYKTGKGKPLAMAKKEDLQLAAYALIVGRKYKVPVTRCALLFLAEDQEVGWEPDAAWLAAKEAELLELFEAVDREENASDGPERFVATPNNLCGWCDYLELCPPGQARIAFDRAAEDQKAGPGEEPPF
jgi:RecB family exonuclease